MQGVAPNTTGWSLSGFISQSSSARSSTQHNGVVSSLVSDTWRCSVKCDVQSLVSVSRSSSSTVTPPEHYGKNAGVPSLMTWQRRLKNRLCSSPYILVLLPGEKGELGGVLACPLFLAWGSESVEEDQVTVLPLVAPQVNKQQTAAGHVPRSQTHTTGCYCTLGEITQTVFNRNYIL